MFSIVAAIDKNRGIGLKNALPWRFRGDMNFFKNLTSDSWTPGVISGYEISTNIQKVPELTRPAELEDDYARMPKETNGRMNSVIMGRKTWDSIPSAYRPLVGRMNMILTRDVNLPGRYVGYNSLDSALRDAAEQSPNTFIIGGAQVYAEAIRHPECKILSLTRINRAYECDTFFPEFESDFQLKAQSPEVVENGCTYFFEMWERK